MKNILNFNIEATKEKLTPRSGVIIFGEYLKGLELEALINKSLPSTNHHSAYNSSEFIYPLLLMLHSGGRVINDIREIKLDKALQTILKIDKIPTPSAFSKYLKRLSNDKENGIKAINKVFLKKFLKSIKTKKEELILDIDASFIEAHKNTALYSYKGEPGYMPIIGHINDGFVIDVDFREGNISPSTKNYEFIKQCINKLPNNTKLDRVRIDSAGYQSNIFNYCDEHKIKFTVSGSLNISVKQSIKEIKSWDKLSGNEEITEFIHSMKNTDNAFRMIVVKKDISPYLTNIDEFLSEKEKEKLHKEMYYCVATNDNDLTAKEILYLHRNRGETSENKIKELKNGFNMSYLPTSNFEANSLYFNVGVLAYNLFLLFKQLLDSSLSKSTIKTIRYKLYNIAGKVVYHARKWILKVNEEFVEILRNIREKAYDVSLQ